MCHGDGSQSEAETDSWVASKILGAVLRRYGRNKERDDKSESELRAIERKVW